ncbi:MAG: protein phosphatase 2C domain-containing protein [Acidobacteria bacterium]|nr:protein phosphatase 2C domain-containing protein [Acidobacteriota bacterium]
MGVTTLRPGEARLFSEQDRLEGAFFVVAGGEVAVFSSRSPVRNTPNEDSAGVIATAEDCGVLAVADGVGGAPAGQHASAVAVTCLVEAVRHAMREGHDARWGVLNGFELANEKVLGLGVGAATTLTVAEISGRAVRAYHVGDSLVLVTGQRGRMKLQTIPHSPVGYGVESGLLDEEDAMHHDERHVISNAIGTSDMRIDVGLPVELARRDTLLLASDGLSDNLHMDEIVATVRKGPLRETTGQLARRALDRMEGGGEDEPSKPDDLTFVVFRPTGA